MHWSLNCFRVEWTQQCTNALLMYPAQTGCQSNRFRAWLIWVFRNVHCCGRPTFACPVCQLPRPAPRLWSCVPAAQFGPLIIIQEISRNWRLLAITWQTVTWPHYRFLSPATNDGYNCFTFGSRDVSIGNAIQLIYLKFNGISNSIPPTILPSPWFTDF